MGNYDRIVEAFQKAAATVLDTCCGLAEAGFQRCDQRLDHASTDIVGVMGMAGELGLTTIIAFPSDLAVKVVAMMSGEEETDLCPNDIDDGIAEFLNMICGNAKTRLNRDGFGFSLSVPAVIRAHDYRIGYHHEVQQAGIRLEFLGSAAQLCLSFGGSPVLQKAE